MVAAARQLHDARADTTLSYGALGTYYLGTTNATQLLISDNSVTLLGNPYGVFRIQCTYSLSVEPLVPFLSPFRAPYANYQDHRAGDEQEQT